MLAGDAAQVIVWTGCDGMPYGETCVIFVSEAEHREYCSL